jgi:hypothetical protein
LVGILDVNGKTPLPLSIIARGLIPCIQPYGLGLNHATGRRTSTAAFDLPLHRGRTGGALLANSGGFMLYASSHPHMQQGEAPPALIGWIMICFGSFLCLLGEALAVCIVITGRFITQRRCYWFAFVTACVQCLFVPFGVILGVFTIIVLSRSSVKQLFGIEADRTPKTKFL